MAGNPGTQVPVLPDIVAVFLDLVVVLPEIGVVLADTRLEFLDVGVVIPDHLLCLNYFLP